MEQIFTVYGKFMLEAAAVVMLLVLLFAGVTDEMGNRGILKIVGASLPVFVTDYEAYTDYGVLVAEAGKEAPVISFHSEGEIWQGESNLSDYIVAEDYSKTRIPVRIRSIISPAGDNVTDDFNRENMIMNFKEAGIYTVRASAVDDGRRRTEKQIFVPVNRKEGED